MSWRDLEALEDDVLREEGARRAASLREHHLVRARVRVRDGARVRVW